MAKSKHLKDPVGKYSGKPVVHKRDTTPLYPDKLTSSQISQGGRTGDCFLLSTINSVLALPEGEKFIRKHMVEKDDKIHVLFYDDYRKPQWITIDKTLPTSSGLLSSGPTWVRYLEKAYTAFKTGDYNKALEGGKSSKALETFIGGSSESLSLPYQSQNKLKDLYKKNICGCSGTDVYALIFLLRPFDKSASKDNMVKHIFKGNEQLLSAWWTWVKQNKSGWEQLLNTHPLTIEKFEAHIHKMEKKHAATCPKEAIQAVVGWLNTNKILPSRNSYSDDEERLFSEMKTAIVNQEPLVTDPKPNPPSGIIMEHSYAIVGVRENPETHRKFVVLRNPYPENRSWFSHLFLSGGRHSTEKIDPKTGQSKLSISSTKSSTFEMELRDFTQAFAYVDKGGSLEKAPFVHEQDESITYTR
ncbi:C2 family cysteine protease [Legionella waltersii]|uniref:Coiled-coil protein n=1 Tax=Legionella waltersii TaxID=66969 RepID=A0A0W1AML9_9GAMM|nr:C2 family cysteine protease [Legionella waltersii]KTD82572.1 coiled-coil protein [Legionella waltersii]SNV02472.1 coiled-coil protein [Legionella waltersii]